MTDEPAARGARTVTLVMGALSAVAALGLTLGLATARVISSGEREIALSTAALKAGDARGATEHARRAAGWYAPGAPHVRVAYQRLLALGTAAEGLGDRDAALFAYRGVRAAALETRWLVTPHADDLDKANRAVARLSSGAPRAPMMRTEPPQKIEREQLEALAYDEAPRAAWVVVLVAAAFTCASGALLAARRALTPSGSLAWRRGLPGAALACAGAAAWLLSVWRA